MLILFDIDGTLLRSHGAGQSGFVAAGRELWGEDFELQGIPLAGRLDPVILADAIRHAGVRPAPGDLEAFQLRYQHHLKRSFESGTRLCEPLPGALSLVQGVRARADLTSGVLTGNWEQSGLIKLSAAGFAPDDFTVRVWGGDAKDRPGLVARAIAQWQGSPKAVVVIGDTPADVACGQAHGCRTIAVTTGPIDRDDLERAGADLVLDALTDVEAVLAWIEGLPV